MRQCKNNIPVLKRENDKCMMDDPNADTHILIEGDNFHVLTAMNMMCGSEGFVDVIYIDPPYNTGEQDFVYNDSFVDSEDGFKHSKWLDFMYKRLQLAKNLLTNNGVLFISIDDHEQANMQLLCDRIFGSNSHVANMIWQRKTGAADAKGIATITEYILVYTKNRNRTEWTNIFKRNEEAYDKDRYRCSDEYLEERGPYYPDTLDRGSIRYSDSMNYPITCPDGTETYPNGRTHFENDGWTWKWSKEKVEWGIENGFIEFRRATNKQSGWSVCYKIYLLVDNNGEPEDKTAPFKNLIQGILNSEGTKDLKKIFGRKVFNNPKPVELIKFLISLVNSNTIVLDFFAGSGTTAQSVLELNNEDGKKRKFIVCTNNENDICTNITFPRISTVITGERQDGSEYSEGIPANLMYYKTDFIQDSRDTDQAKYCLVEKVDELLCIIEETYVAKERTYYFSHYETLSGDKHTFIYSEYYNDVQFVDFTEHINAVDGEKVVYMFSTDNNVDTRLFDGMDVTVKPIPSKIYEIYKEIVEDIKRGEQ